MAQDLAAGEKHTAGGGHAGVGDTLLAEAAGEAAGDVAKSAIGASATSLGGKLLGHAFTVGAMVLNIASKNGLKKVDDLVRRRCSTRTWRKLCSCGYRIAVTS